ncbi:tRNA lysidine(34) synthetase TilS [Alphaproteobacteria bacterium 46_93_T64]|nr:tRNA lysidine(34) synthetase TilS [Alphaproteobacteria bacterium 46_93_T64]
MTTALPEKFDIELEQIFRGEQKPRRIAVAVSGGSDSMALCSLANTWCAKHKVDLVALTVDHGLREEAASEAELVHDWLKAQDIEHVTLTRKGPAPFTGLQEFARNARYRLLLDKCHEIGASALFVGHQMEDQLETFLMRFSKGSALQGLSVMRPKVRRSGIDLVRPMLVFRRAELREYLDALEQDWVEDPSNENPEYTRTELGRVLNVMSNLPGSDHSSMALSVNRVQRADNALRQIARLMFSQKANIDPLGFVQIPEDFYVGVPAEINVRFLMEIFQTVRCAGVHIKLIHIEQLLDRLVRMDQRVAVTMAGCQMRPFKKSWIICREPGRSDLPEEKLEGLHELVWDNRFKVIDNATADERVAVSNFEIRRLGDAGWRQLAESVMPSDILNLPSMVRKNLPALWNGDEIVAMPLFSEQNTVLGIAKGRFEMVFIPKINQK